MTKKKGVPEGWLPVSAVGKPIEGTRFLAFKVPLKETLCNNLQPEERFSPAMLLEKEPNLRLVIDLTNTKRYYDKNEFTQNGVNYEKIFCPGREIPERNLMNRFFNVVDNFMQSEDTEDKFIGVHCTHGINRTGYFICTYMIQKLGFTPDKAISAFQEARGHEIIREYFIQELMKEDTIKYDGKSYKIEETFKNSNNSHSSRDRSPHKHNTHRHSPHKSNSNWRQRSPPRPVDHHSRRGPPGDHNNWRHRGRPQHQSGPSRERLHPAPNLYAQRSQLNYYEDDHYRRFNWRRDDSRGRRRHPDKKNSDS